MGPLIWKHFYQPRVLFLLLSLKSSVKVVKYIALLVLAAKVLHGSYVKHVSKTPGQACCQSIRMLIGDESMIDDKQL